MPRDVRTLASRPTAAPDGRLTDRGGVPRAVRRLVSIAACSAVTLAAGAMLSPMSGAQDARGGQDNRPANAADARRELEDKRGQLDTAETRAKSLEQDVQDLAQSRERLNARLVETAALIQKSEARLSSIEARLGELDAQQKLLQGSLAQRHDQIAKLLSALLRMGRNPPPVMITRREDALEMVRSAMLLSAAFPELREQALSLAGRLNELVRVMTDIRTEGDRLKLETTRLTEARTRLAGLMENKKQSLAERQAELEDVRKSAASISKSVNELNDLISQLDKAVTEKTALGAYEQEIKSAEAAAAAAPAADAAKDTGKPATAPTTVAEAKEGAAKPEATVSDGKPSAGSDGRPSAGSDGRPSAEAKAAETRTADATAGDAKPAADAKPVAAEAKPDKGEIKVAALPVPPKPAIELAPSASGAVPGNLGRMKPAIPFQQAKSRLPLPAQGRRVISFGEKTQYGGASKGIVLETRSGAQITSPCDGWVVYAGEFRSYGQLLIINAGGGYHVLLAGLSQINVQPGQFILAAEPIGTMIGQATSGAAKPQPSSAPVLYVEFRKDNRPVDPDPWWVDRQEAHQKVQG